MMRCDVIQGLSRTSVSILHPYRHGLQPQGSIGDNPEGGVILEHGIGLPGNFPEWFRFQVMRRNAGASISDMARGLKLGDKSGNREKRKKQQRTKNEKMSGLKYGFCR